MISQWQINDLLMHQFPGTRVAVEAIVRVTGGGRARIETLDQEGVIRSDWICINRQSANSSQTDEI